MITRFPRKPRSLSNQEWIWKNIRMAPADNCWNWIGNIQKDGYPHISLDGRDKKAIHAIWESTNKKIQFGHVVYQRCANKICCRPNHLAIKTERKTGSMIKIPWEDRYWRFINKETVNGCWEWMGANNHGYGEINIDQYPHTTHRLGWEIKHGKIENGLHVLHKCNNRSCCNPDHLYLGTNAENGIDRATAGVFKGEGNPQAKLTKENVLDIRESSKTIRLTVLAKQFNVNISTISKIKNKQRWAHI